MAASSPVYERFFAKGRGDFISCSLFWPRWAYAVSEIALGPSKNHIPENELGKNRSALGSTGACFCVRHGE